jgi:hypothetical protein
VRVFDKVLEKIVGKPENGHAIANAKNKIALAQAHKEISDMFDDIKRKQKGIR